MEEMLAQKQPHHQPFLYPDGQINLGLLVEQLPSVQLRNKHHHRSLMNIPLIILCLAFASCSTKHPDNNILPRYSDMGAAEVAGKVPAYGN
jgi:hypothetical protein